MIDGQADPQRGNNYNNHNNSNNSNNPSPGGGKEDPSSGHNTPWIRGRQVDSRGGYVCRDPFSPEMLVPMGALDDDSLPITLGVRLLDWKGEEKGLGDDTTTTTTTTTNTTTTSTTSYVIIECSPPGTRFLKPISIRVPLLVSSAECPLSPVINVSWRSPDHDNSRPQQQWTEDLLTPDDDYHVYQSQAGQWIIAIQTHYIMSSHLMVVLRTPPSFAQMTTDWSSGHFDAIITGPQHLTEGEVAGFGVILTRSKAAQDWVMTEIERYSGGWQVYGWKQCGSFLPIDSFSEKGIEFELEEQCNGGGSGSGRQPSSLQITPSNGIIRMKPFSHIGVGFFSLIPYFATSTPPVIKCQVSPHGGLSPKSSSSTTTTTTSTYGLYFGVTITFPAAVGVNGTMRLEELEQLARVGKGSFGSVYLLHHQVTRRHYALKVLQHSSSNGGGGGGSSSAADDFMALFHDDISNRPWYSNTNLFPRILSVFPPSPPNNNHNHNNSSSYCSQVPATIGGGRWSYLMDHVKGSDLLEYLRHQTETGTWPNNETIHTWCRSV